MAGNKYRWVCTDRRSDAEILNEIALADTPVVIVSREEPSKLVTGPVATRRRFPWEIHLLEWPTERREFRWKLIADWPAELSLLVMPPWSFGLIAILTIKHADSPANSAVTSLWDWLILCQSNGGKIIHEQMMESPEFASLGHSPRRVLCPGAASRLSDIIRTQIQKLAGMSFPTVHADVTALRAGLFQWHDALDESHECSQSIEGQGKHRAGDYWHAIMHRREPDYGNAKYWFRRVGRHPIFAELGRRAEPLIAAAAPEWTDRLLKGGWDPFAFVDLCETVADGRNEAWVTLAETIQELEMLLLLKSTYQDAIQPA